MNKEEFIAYIDSNFHSLTRATLFFDDETEETVSLHHTHRQPPSSIRHNSTPRSPLFPVHPANIPMTLRSSRTWNHKIEKLLDVIQFPINFNMTLSVTNDKTTLIGLVAHINNSNLMLTSMNNIYNYLIRATCQHSRGQAYHGRCEVCVAFLLILNRFPEVSSFWKELLWTLEQDYQYRTATLLLNEGLIIRFNALQL